LAINDATAKSPLKTRNELVRALWHVFDNRADRSSAGSGSPHILASVHGAKLVEVGAF
jgi:hypothetical protein